MSTYIPTNKRLRFLNIRCYECTKFAYIFARDREKSSHVINARAKYSLPPTLIPRPLQTMILANLSDRLHGFHALDTPCHGAPTSLSISEFAWVRDTARRSRTTFYRRLPWLLVRHRIVRGNFFPGVDGYYTTSHFWAIGWTSLPITFLLSKLGGIVELLVVHDRDCGVTEYSTGTHLGL